MLTEWLDTNTTLSIIYFLKINKWKRKQTLHCNTTGSVKWRESLIQQSSSRMYPWVDEPWIYISHLHLYWQLNQNQQSKYTGMTKIDHLRSRYGKYQQDWIQLMWKMVRFKSISIPGSDNDRWDFKTNWNVNKARMVWSANVDSFLFLLWKYVCV